MRLSRILHLLATLITLALASSVTAATAHSKPAFKPCPNNVLDNCYDRKEMREFARVAADMVEHYLSAITPNQPVRPPAVTFVPTGKHVTAPCADEIGRQSADSTAYFYCPLDSAIYVGQDQIWQFYHEFGAVSPVVGLAHEFGHFAQDVAGVPEPTSFGESVTHENQADCFAGAFTNFLRRQGSLEVGDVSNIGALLKFVGSQEGPGRDHGTAAERQAAFNKGFKGTLTACNSFYPRNPIAR
ncbi:hypothetical protein FOS14_00770 [Skermania sp. ID1734]|uniref:neutral zinc metallopeptidase n=1 Tax=Skermania sp. ID1734 TaxID=2597516 RepID=UPI00117D3F8F|nr:neutral zinc metallopeptidase [Skermania sp. ID1734]TSE01959.1 hypothetical protein FOS14_00770 [Skermania sp. ID1734]